jgi:MoxR-like ATPase
MEGTYPLPEAQLDRFLLQVRLPFPDQRELVAVLAGVDPAVARDPAVTRDPVLTRDDVRRLRALVAGVPASSDVVARVARLVLATHPRPDAPEDVRRFVRHGASPRGGLAVLAAARARALARGRLHVADEDLEAVARPALRHRLILGYEGEAAGVSTDALVEAALEASRG